MKLRSEKKTADGQRTTQEDNPDVPKDEVSVEQDTTPSVSPRALRRSCLNAQLPPTKDNIPSKKPKVAFFDAIENEQSQRLAVITPVKSSKSYLVQSPSLPPATKLPIRKFKPQGRQIGDDTVYQVKWVIHEEQECPIITQNKNGPCPLIGIVNVHLLQKKLRLNENVLEISEDELISHLHAAITNSLPRDSDLHNPNQVQNVQDAISLLPQLRTGLHVNVKFTGVKNFEYTPECLIFDTLNIPLYHGWVMDPQCADVVDAIGNQSYNQVVESIVLNKTSADPNKLCKATIAETFLEETASQLTLHGLSELNLSLKDGELGILFRNNHFIVLHKHKNSLLQLVTDQGFLEEPQVVWETLSSVNGDEAFLNGYYKHSLVKGNVSSLSAAAEQQISTDFLVALSLQDEQNNQQDKDFGWDAFGNALGAIGMTSDEVLAQQLHIQEESKAKMSSPPSTSPQREASAESMAPTVSEQPQQTQAMEPARQSREWKCVVS